jgi:hypothetical protein
MTQLTAMPPKKKSKDTSPTGKRFPSREKIKYVGIPTNFWEALESMSVAEGTDPRFEGRSVAYMSTLAIREFLEKHGKLPPTK